MLRPSKVAKKLSHSKFRLLLLLLIIVFSLKVKTTLQSTVPIIAEASSLQFEEPRLIQ